ncbi:MAG: hypothetical protein R2778_19020 [Saprospiraceae bacterium]
MLFLFSVSGIRSQDADKWVYKGEKSNIKIYHQETEGLLHIQAHDVGEGASGRYFVSFLRYQHVS